MLPARDPKLNEIWLWPWYSQYTENLPFSDFFPLCVKILSSLHLLLKILWNQVYANRKIWGGGGIGLRNRSITPNFPLMTKHMTGFYGFAIRNSRIISTSIVGDILNFYYISSKLWKKLILQLNSRLSMYCKLMFVTVRKLWLQTH